MNLAAGADWYHNGTFCYLFLGRSTNGFSHYLLSQAWLILPPEPRAGITSELRFDGNMEVLVVRITTRVLSITLFCEFF